MSGSRLNHFTRSEVNSHHLIFTHPPSFFRVSFKGLKNWYSERRHDGFKIGPLGVYLLFTGNRDWALTNDTPSKKFN